MGGKSSGTPPPDPKLIEAQIQSLGIQNDAIQRMMSMSEEMAPLQREQLQQSIEQSRQLWNWNQDDREFAIGKRDQLSGIQDTIVKDAASFSETDRRDQLSAQSDSDIAQAFDQQKNIIARDLTRSGVNPNDGRNSATKGAMAVSEALARVQGRKSASDSARLEGLQLTDRANNALAGYPSMSMGAQGQGVGTMGAGIAAFNSGMNGMMQSNAMISSAAGQMGSNATNMYGQQANAYQQSQASNSGLMGSLGTALGIAGGAWLGK
ncbi:hypothetical protein E8K88_12025 [Lampropedia aestuarii]|uniref:Uncharacterized protein n=1 Tax=Lampropedia aestuarii TaxID=2562762 RepID=A0A4S5BJA9_9BURK|nr:hypothetical protein [Lampropedia aestuarii]THJ32420.1 hypothetical protein E8K88_12025 [Lampropedia aestuarii]